MQTVLVPLDGSELAERALPLASVIAGQAGARLVLVQAVPSTPTSEFSERLLAEKYLEQVASPLLAEGRSVEVSIAEGEPGPAICEAAQRSDANTIVMS